MNFQQAEGPEFQIISRYRHWSEQNKCEKQTARRMLKEDLAILPIDRWHLVDQVAGKRVAMVTAFNAAISMRRCQSRNEYESNKSNQTGKSIAA
jgi:hypothetical protein